MKIASYVYDRFMWWKASPSPPWRIAAEQATWGQLHVVTNLRASGMKLS